MVSVLRDKLQNMKELQKLIRTSDQKIFLESIFPKFFGDTALQVHSESEASYRSLFEDAAKYQVIMNVLGTSLYRELRSNSAN